MECWNPQLSQGPHEPVTLSSRLKPAFFLRLVLSSQSPDIIISCYRTLIEFNGLYLMNELYINCTDIKTTKASKKGRRCKDKSQRV